MEDSAQGYLSHSGFDVWIVVDGVRAPMYGMEHNEAGNQTSCWIASTTDKEFSVSLRRKEMENNGYRVQIFLDGHLVATKINVALKDDPRGVATYTISTTRTSATEERKFMFGTLELSDDDVLLEDPLTQNIGEIKVTIQRVEIVGTVPSKSNIYAVPSSHKVHERSKKGLEHGVKYGPAQAATQGSTSTSLYHPLNERITFVFRYRPLDMLRANNVAPPLRSVPEERHETPRSRPPTARPKKRDISTVKAESDEIGEFEEENIEDKAAKEHESLAELERVRDKQRSMTERGRPTKKIKTERKRYFTPGEVIDLT
ncbi:hypothetical protein BDN70DRAFT_932416 [Pholiota conissans]|uniref:DUF7918 domain-containing protein n=1 Tax=Pholiota conissans TaxID=109636 RepID=A0A9P5Z480_9AGAR|nr:hypothetical protein BDN70DRAFT_932416 [Pholiota conissans]